MNKVQVLCTQYVPIIMGVAKLSSHLYRLPNMMVVEGVVDVVRPSSSSSPDSRPRDTSTSTNNNWMQSDGKGEEVLRFIGGCSY